MLSATPFLSGPQFPHLELAEVSSKGPSSSVTLCPINSTMPSSSLHWGAWCS